MKTSAQDVFSRTQPLPRSEVNTAQDTQMVSRQALQQALKNREFLAFYQPKLSIEHGKLDGVEALARWAHPQQGLLTPAFFIDALQTYGLMDELFMQLFEQGLALRQQLAALDKPIAMSFNLQPSQLNNHSLVQAIKRLLSTYYCPPTAVTFEITETGAFNVDDNSLNHLIELRLLGCNLSMDDFGTGFSSLERLCELPFNELKLDGTFVRKLATHASSATIIENAVSLARALGISFVVEGVETLEQIKQLRALGCSTMQGYGIARPMPQESLLHYLLQLGSFQQAAHLCA